MSTQDYYFLKRQTTQGPRFWNYTGWVTDRAEATHMSLPKACEIAALYPGVSVDIYDCTPIRSPS